MASATLPRSRKAAKTALKVSLCLAIDHTAYAVTPIRSQDTDVIRAWRLVKQSNREDVYDVAETVHGFDCTCPDFETRRRGLDEAGCKHCKAAVIAGLIDAPNAAVDRAIRKAAEPGPVEQAPAQVAGVTRPRDEFDEPAAPKIPAELPPAAGAAPEPAEAKCCAPTEPAPCSACLEVPAETDDRPTVAAILADSFPPPEADDQAEEQAGRLTLAQAIQAQADAFKAHGTDFGTLLAEAIEALAMDVHFHGSATPAQYRRDLQLARDRDYEAFRKAEEQAEGRR